MFTAIGGACPNLKVLDLSDLTHLQGESILYLLFRQALQHRQVHHRGEGRGGAEGWSSVWEQ